MRLELNMKIADIKIDKVFIRSYINIHIEDLRSVVIILRERIVSLNITTIIILGLDLIK
jgi:homoaconitase/3-isopropylmalate dehydratase large subunit